MRQCSKKLADLKKKKQKFENKDMNIFCILHNEIYVVCCNYIYLNKLVYPNIQNPIKF